MSVKIEGLDEVLIRLEETADTSKLGSVMGDACATVERAARQKAPKVTGDLRRSIESDVDISGTKVVGKVFSPLEYAPYVEYGTGLYAENGGRKDVPWAYEDEKTGELIWTAGQHPKPYMRPALNENRNKIINIIKRGLKQ